jgi:hypothetical protein
MLPEGRAALTAHGRLGDLNFHSPVAAAGANVGAVYMFKKTVLPGAHRGGAFGKVRLVSSPAQKRNVLADPMLCFRRQSGQFCEDVFHAMLPFRSG